MAYDLDRCKAYSQITDDGGFKDMVIEVLFALVSGEDVRPEDLEMLQRYRQVKVDIPKTEQVLECKYSGMSKAEADYADSLDDAERREYLRLFGIE